jgi:hypothetical protein
MSASTPLPRWRGHKTVYAARITGFRQNGNPLMPDVLLGDVGGIVSMLEDWHAKHAPHVGGYFVQYEDGYTSFSPAEAFESGYVRATGPGMDFGQALAQLKRGRMVARAGWNGKGMWLALQTPDAQSKMTLPYIFMRTAQGDNVPWLASQTDMLGEDWEVVL